MSSSVFLPQAPTDLRLKLQRLIDISMGDMEVQSGKQATWNAEFFGVAESPYWKSLNALEQEAFLRESSAGILQEALAIEHAGVSYAHKMADQSETQEEKFYYTCVAHEELQHLRWLSPFSDWQTHQELPFFAEMIGGWIATEDRPSLLLMIQILLEGWGIHYYGSLSKNCDSVELQNVFKQILQDESRHHAGGLILFEKENKINPEHYADKIQSLLNVIRMGPYGVALSLARLNDITLASEIESLLFSIKAEQTSREKLNVIKRLLVKCFDPLWIETLQFDPLSLPEMAGLIASVANAKIPEYSTETSV